MEKMEKIVVSTDYPMVNIIPDEGSAHRAELNPGTHLQLIDAAQRAVDEVTEGKKVSSIRIIVFSEEKGD